METFQFNNIPTNIIYKCKETFKQYPSIIEVHPDYVKSDLDKTFKRSRLVWINEEINSNSTKIIKYKVFEYDPTGIFVVINSDNKLFILTTIERKNVSDFMVNNLKQK